MALPQAQQPAEFTSYVNAVSLDEALQAMAESGVTVVAGGTDLWVQKDLAAKSVGSTLVNIKRVPELAGIEQAGEQIRLGALTTLTEVLDSDLLSTKVPVLPATANRFASVQVRNVATVGGNIANASPAADFVIPLMCLDATVETACWRDGKVETRALPITKIFTGPGQTQLDPAELITGIVFDVPGDGFRAGFCKSGPRPALEIALVSLCLAGTVVDGALQNPRIACGAVAPTPIRATKTEAVLDGNAIGDDLIAKALDMLDSEIAPIDDHRASAWYRRRLARVFLEQELRNVAQG